MPASNKGFYKFWFFKIDRFKVVWRREHSKEKYVMAPTFWAEELLQLREDKKFPFEDD